MKIFVFGLFILTLSSCSFFNSSIVKRYNKLDERFVVLTDDEIEEKDRKKLQKDFENFVKDLREEKKETNLDNIFEIDEYIHKSNIKIEFLKDLK